jgi:outer membrane receptor for ferrienterochelin and colicin
MEVLRRAPGIQIQNEKISINGKNKISILIDGKASPYVDMNAVIREIPASNINKIEVITNPSAKNEAEGGAIINIIMKRNGASGTNGSLSLTQGGGVYNQDIVNKGNLTYHRISPVISFNHRNHKWNFYGITVI